MIFFSNPVEFIRLLQQSAVLWDVRVSAYRLQTDKDLQERIAEIKLKIIAQKSQVVI